MEEIRIEHDNYVIVFSKPQEDDQPKPDIEEYYKHIAKLLYNSKASG